MADGLMDWLVCRTDGGTVADSLTVTDGLTDVAQD